MENKSFKNSPFHRALKKLLQGDEWYRRQGVLAKECNLSQGYMSDLRAGNRSPSMETVEKIAEVVGMSVNDFLSIGDEDNGHGDSIGSPSPDRRIADRRIHDNVIDLNHEKLVAKFQDKDMAYKLNEALINIERLHPSIYEEMAAYIIKTSEDLTRLRQYRPQPECPELNRKKK